MRDSDGNLVRRALEGEREAFGTLVERYERYVYAIGLSVLGDAEAARDAVQETFLRAYGGLASLQDPEGFRHWLASIARNAATDERRRVTRIECHPEARPVEERPTVLSEADPARIAQTAELAERVLAAIRALPEIYHAPLLLRYVERIDYAGIAVAIGTSRDAVRGLLYRGNRLLREKLLPLLAEVEGKP
ncbi:MAG: sigma-70 family RNA polymerase sigma factor [Planctomycetes bacterium]|nr:sigma-70 family RNA polymerase sigma factor [Planctomycetota bacterium]